VLEAATFAPTGGNAQPWRAVVVRDPAKKQTLAALYSERWFAYSAHHRKLIARAPAEAIAKAERMLAAGDYLASHFAQTPAVVIFCFNPQLMALTDEKQNRPHVVGGGSIYPAVQNLLLACRAEGLGCVLTTLLCAREKEVRELLEIPEPWATSAFVPIGWPQGGGHGPLARRPVAQVAFADRFGEALFPSAEEGPR
jgi:nitroreductase